ncbi:MAG TPA: helix-turn-helix transcriptional regulator [Solirubrobacteraceae bacterium]|jgi:transcriptional regulator with XRE-family HTH domain|nr:helix-turn-helix transcriptional regulator [Solirubrobacteraceae bacterium]
MPPTRRRAEPDTDAYRTLGKALRELREQAGLTQEALAARVDIGATYVSQVENGHRGIRWHTLLAFLRALDVDLRQLGEAVDKQEHHST